MPEVKPNGIKLQLQFYVCDIVSAPTQQEQNLGSGSRSGLAVIPIPPRPLRAACPDTVIAVTYGINQ